MKAALITRLKSLESELEGIATLPDLDLMSFLGEMIEIEKSVDKACGALAELIELLEDGLETDSSEHELADCASA